MYIYTLLLLVVIINNAGISVVLVRRFNIAGIDHGSSVNLSQEIAHVTPEKTPDSCYFY